MRNITATFIRRYGFFRTFLPVEINIFIEKGPNPAGSDPLFFESVMPF